MGKSPAFRLYASDFYMDTQTWSNEEVGVYLRLLLYQWINGSIPNDDKKMRKICSLSARKWSKIWPNISHKFVTKNEQNLIKLRLEEEREKQLKYKEKLSKAGKKGMENRYKKANEVSKDVINYPFGEPER